MEPTHFLQRPRRLLRGLLRTRVRIERLYERRVHLVPVHMIVILLTIMKNINFEELNERQSWRFHMRITKYEIVLTHTHVRTHARTHARTDARTHTNKQYY